ncbi:glutamate--cysteine ligase [Actinosynnema sp. NPDC023587]|uniref:carboxylate-amine ligase n=1 Tax=Actinosynnema sp. NPDC023587 TaxID=3154695 RepID=UPI0033F0CC6B
MINDEQPLLGTDVPTLAVVEEFLVVDPGSGLPVPVAGEVVDLANRLGADLKPEPTRAQVESGTPVCRTLREVRGHLLTARSTASAAALQAGARLLAVGVPLAGPAEQSSSDSDRHQRIDEGYGPPAAEHGVCGCHVHVAVPDRETAVQVCNHVRPWLPVLLALTANSPIHQGVDTGYASRRSVLTSRRPCSGAPPYFTSASHYDAVLDMLVDSGEVSDPAMVYWDVRPSDHLPAVEIRVSDVPATVDESILLAALVRALVTTALGAIGRGDRGLPVAAEAVSAAYWRAAHDGIEGDGIDLFAHRRVPAAHLLRRLVRHVRPALRHTGELRAVSALFTKVLHNGNGAVRQRRAFQRRGRIEDVVELLSRDTGQDWLPDTAA